MAVETLVGRASHLGRSGIEPEHRMTGAPTRVTSFVMDPSLSMANLERKLFPTFKPRDKDPVLFDLSGCTWIEPTVLLYLIATLKSRIIHGWPTTLRLPRNENVLYFLEAWRFPEAFQAATGKAFADVVDGNGAEYFKSDHTESNPYLGAHVETPYGADRLLSKYYFEIHTFQRQRDLFEPAFALSEAAKWGRMSLVLRSVLRGPSNLLASRIVYEALANAIRPHARLGDIVMAALASRGAQVQQRIRRPGLKRECFLVNIQKMVETDRAARLLFDLVEHLLKNFIPGQVGRSGH